VNIFFTNPPSLPLHESQSIKLNRLKTFIYQNEYSFSSIFVQIIKVHFYLVIYQHFV